MAIPVLTETIAVTNMTLRGINSRIGLVAAALAAVAVVVFVMIGFLSMADGFDRTVAGTGSDQVAIIMRTNAGAELNSSVGLEQSRVIATAPGIASDENGVPMVSPELYVVADATKRDDGLSANVTLRGMNLAGIEIRDKVEILEGRAFEPGRNELMVGRAARSQFANLDLGNSIKLGPTTWTIVGIFAASGGSVFESEIWADARLVQDVFRRGSFQVMRARIDGPDGLERINAFLSADARLNSLSAVTESSYYAEQSEPLSNFIRYLGYPLAIIMALGAMAGALNSMYSTVAARRREIATLRALGFGGFSTFVATLLESALLAIVGGVLGCIGAYLFFNGMGAATLGSSFTQVVFNLHVSKTLVINGMILAVMVGVVGGFSPAIRAARMPLIAAFRDD